MENVVTDRRIGCVILADALGVRNKTIEEAGKFIEFIRAYKLKLEPHLISLKEKGIMVKIATFGDTLLLAIYLEDENYFGEGDWDRNVAPINLARIVLSPLYFMALQSKFF